jgi:dual specificity tyrosine-phosphorylation-regulated kinase 2/3/4
MLQCPHSNTNKQPLAEGRPRKRFQRTASENEDPRRTGANLPMSRGPGPVLDMKSGQTKRRSTVRDSKPPLLGPRPLEQGKR